VWGGDALRTPHVSIMFWSCPQKLWDFHHGSSVGQDNLTKANWPPHWDHGKNRRAHLNLLTNILNIKNIISLDKISVPKSKSINFGAYYGRLNGFWGFLRWSQCGGQFTLASSPKAQLIMHCPQHELWQNASTMHWVKSANSRKRVEQFFWVSFEI